MAKKRKYRKGAARTAKQKAALRKAQLASARKRRGKGAKIKRHFRKNKAIYKGVALAASATAIEYGIKRGIKKWGRAKGRKSTVAALQWRYRERFARDRSPFSRALLREATKASVHNSAARNRRNGTSPVRAASPGRTRRAPKPITGLKVQTKYNSTAFGRFGGSETGRRNKRSWLF